MTAATPVPSRLHARLGRVAVGTLLAVALTTGGAMTTMGVTPALGATATRANHACTLLRPGEITGVLTAAPLDPGPSKVRIPQARKNFSRCEWDDHLVPQRTQLAVYTGLARKLTATQRANLGVAAAGSAARDLTPEELRGLGDRGAVEIIRDGTYGSVSVLRGNDSFFVSAAYQGPGALPTITEADMLALARLAAPRL